MSEYDRVWDLYQEAVTHAPEGEDPDYWIYFYHAEQTGREVKVNLPGEDPKRLVLDGKGYVPVMASSAKEAKRKVESVPGVTEATGADYYDNGPTLAYLRSM